MCTSIHEPGQEIETVKDLIGFLGSADFVVDKHYKFADINSCLCQIDVRETLEKHGIKYKIDGVGDYEILPPS